MANAIQGQLCSQGREKCQRLHVYYLKLPERVRKEVDAMVDEHDDLEWGRRLLTQKAGASSPTNSNKRKSNDEDTDSE